MGKKINRKFPDCCAAAKKLDNNIGGALCTTLQRNPKTEKYDQGPIAHLRDEWHFKFCPYCGERTGEPLIKDCYLITERK